MLARAAKVDSQRRMSTIWREFIGAILSVSARDLPTRKSPEDWLASNTTQNERGVFKLFLGYAPGVGKTFSMLSEGIRRRGRGEDVVIGVVETHGRKGTAELADKLEQVPRREVEYKGTLFSGQEASSISYC